ATEQGHAFLEMEMDRMVPTSAAVDDGPVLDLARPRDQCRNPVGVEGMGFLSVHLDRPWKRCEFRAVRGAFTCLRIARVAAARPPNHEDPDPYRCDDRNLLVQHCRHLAAIRVVGVVDEAWHVDALDLADDPEFEDGADRRIVWVAGKGLRQREFAVWPAPVGPPP